MNGMNDIDIYKLYNDFLSRYDLYPKPVPGHPGYTATQLGCVYKPDGSEAKQFNSCGYKQVRMIDDNGNRSIKGVHQVVAMTFDKGYFPDCVVHHIDEDKHNNCLEIFNAIHVQIIHGCMQIQHHYKNILKNMVQLIKENMVHKSFEINVEKAH